MFYSEEYKRLRTKRIINYILGCVVSLLIGFLIAWYMMAYTDQVWKLARRNGTVICLQVPPKDKNQKDYDYVLPSNKQFKELEKKVKKVEIRGDSYKPPKEFVRK